MIIINTIIIKITIKRSVDLYIKGFPCLLKSDSQLKHNLQKFLKQLKNIK